MHNRLLGTWKVDSYESSELEGTKTSLQNAGTINFLEDGRGVKDVTFRAMGDYRDNSPFTWSNTGTSVTIQGDLSEFAKSWIVITNKRKRQIWKSTNGKGGIQQLKLSR
jgi:hypothetical protein